MSLKKIAVHFSKSHLSKWSVKSAKAIKIVIILNTHRSGIEKKKMKNISILWLIITY